MARPVNPRDTKTELLKAAAAQLTAHGSGAFSFRTLAKDLGVKSATVHYYFPSKKDLTFELVQFFRDRFTMWEKKLGQVPARARFEAYLQLSQKITGKNRNICPLGALSIEFSGLDPKAQAALRDLHLQQRSFLENVFAELRMQNSDKPGKIKRIDRESAELVLSTIQGALQLSRIRKDSAMHLSVIATLRQKLEI